MGGGGEGEEGGREGGRVRGTRREGVKEQMGKAFITMAKGVGPSEQLLNWHKCQIIASILIHTDIHK